MQASGLTSTWSILSEGLGHLDRHAGLKGYCTGLMLPLARKSVEPMAARVDPLHASARHQSLHHFVAKAEWSDREMLRRVCQWVVPQMDFSRGGCWIIDDTGFPKKGKHSVGVARQYCGMLGKQDNCQVAVSVSLASDQGSVPVAWQLYLPEDWAEDADATAARPGCPRSCASPPRRRSRWRSCAALLAEGAPQALRAGRCRLWRGHRLSPGAQRHGPALRRGRHLGGRGLAPRGRAAATQALQRNGPPTGDAAAHRPAPTRERQGAGPVACRRSAFQTISWREGTNEAAQRALRRAACAPRRRQRWQGAPAPSAVVADRVARGRRRADASTSCPRYPKTRRSTIWSSPPISAGASSATTRTSSRTSGWVTTRAAVGAGSTTMPA